VEWLVVALIWRLVKPMVVAAVREAIAAELEALEERLLAKLSIYPQHLKQEIVAEVGARLERILADFTKVLKWF